MLYMFIRYGPLTFIAMQLSSKSRAARGAVGLTVTSAYFSLRRRLQELLLHNPRGEPEDPSWHLDTGRLIWHSRFARL